MTLKHLLEKFPLILIIAMTELKGFCLASPIDELETINDQGRLDLSLTLSLPGSRVLSDGTGHDPLDQHGHIKLSPSQQLGVLACNQYITEPAGLGCRPKRISSTYGVQEHGCSQSAWNDGFHGTKRKLVELDLLAHQGSSALRPDSPQVFPEVYKAGKKTEAADASQARLSTLNLFPQVNLKQNESPGSYPIGFPSPSSSSPGQDAFSLNIGSSRRYIDRQHSRKDKMIAVTRRPKFPEIEALDPAAFGRTSWPSTATKEVSKLVDLTNYPVTHSPPQPRKKKMEMFQQIENYARGLSSSLAFQLNSARADATKVIENYPENIFSQQVNLKTLKETMSSTELYCRRRQVFQNNIGLLLKEIYPSVRKEMHSFIEKKLGILLPKHQRESNAETWDRALARIKHGLSKLERLAIIVLNELKSTMEVFGDMSVLETQERNLWLVCEEMFESAFKQEIAPVPISIVYSLKLYRMNINDQLVNTIFYGSEYDNLEVIAVAHFILIKWFETHIPALFYLITKDELTFQKFGWICEDSHLDKMAVKEYFSNYHKELRLRLFDSPDDKKQFVEKFKQICQENSKK